jgi:RNA binding exosome subunit
MDTITVDKTKLLDILKKNRTTHKAIYEEAFEGYRLECIRILEANLKNLHSKKKVIVSFYEQAPQDQTKDYDLIIRMLEMEVGSTIDLNQQQFANYVDDNWNWKHIWTTNNAKYSSTIASGNYS